MNPFQQSQDSIVNILESMPTYGLAMKFIHVFCIKDFIDTKAHRRLQKHFTKQITTNKIVGTKLSGKWHSNDDKPAKIIFCSNGLIKLREEWAWFGMQLITGKPWKINYYNNGKIKCKEIAHQTGYMRISYHPNGNCKFKEWLNDGHCLQRFPGPCRINYYSNGSVSSKEYQHENGESKYSVQFDTNGKIELEHFFDKNGCTHRRGGPALIRYREDGTFISKKWYRHNKCHRKHGPAQIRWFENGQVENAQYFINGILKGSMEWYEDGTIESESFKDHTYQFYRNGNLEKQIIPKIEISYYKNGKIRKEKHTDLSEKDRPAILYYDKQGKITKEEWWWQGKRWNSPDKPAVVEYS